MESHDTCPFPSSLSRFTSRPRVAGRDGVSPLLKAAWYPAVWTDHGLLMRPAARGPVVLLLPGYCESHGREHGKSTFRFFEESLSIFTCPWGAGSHRGTPPAAPAAELNEGRAHVGVAAAGGCSAPEGRGRRAQGCGRGPMSAPDAAGACSLRAGSPDTQVNCRSPSGPRPTASSPAGGTHFTTRSQFGVFASLKCS